MLNDPLSIGPFPSLAIPGPHRNAVHVIPALDPSNSFAVDLPLKAVMAITRTNLGTGLQYPAMPSVATLSGVGRSGVTYGCSGPTFAPIPRPLVRGASPQRRRPFTTIERQLTGQLANVRLELAPSLLTTGPHGVPRPTMDTTTIRVGVISLIERPS